MYLPRFAGDNTIRERLGALIEILARGAEAPPRNATSSVSDTSVPRAADDKGFARRSAVQGGPVLERAGLSAPEVRS